MNFTIEKPTPPADTLPIALTPHAWLKAASGVLSQVPAERRTEFVLWTLEMFSRAGVQTADYRHFVEASRWWR